MYFIEYTSISALFVECLKSLPNLHTLSIGSTNRFDPTPLAKALKGVNLPQIKTLLLLPENYPLLQHCPNVEDVVCSTRVINGPCCDGFLKSLLSNQDSKVERLTIPLVLRLLPNPSRKRSSTPRDHEVILMTDRLRLQNLRLRVQGLPNSL